MRDLDSGSQNERLGAVRLASAGRPTGASRRYWIVALCFSAVVICYIDRVNLSVASLAMQDTFAWTATTKGLVLSSFFVGYVLFQVPAGYLVNRFGARKVLLYAVLWWSFCTMLTPAAARSVPSLIAVRIAMGLGESATFPGAYSLFAQHVPVPERSRSVTLLLSGIPVGTLLGLSTSGYLVAAWGWSSAFYAFGAAGVVWALVWKYRVPVQNHASSVRSANAVPWSALLRSTAVWALIINHFCSNWVLYMLVAWLPSYFWQTQHLSVARAGLASAAPWLTMIVMTNLGGWLADKLATKVSLLSIRKGMQAAGLLGSAVVLLLVRFVEDPAVAELAICAALSALALTWSGFTPNHLEIAPKHADVLMSITNTAGTLPGIIGVAVTGWLVDKTGGYNSAFALAASINIVGAIVWLAYARVTPIYSPS